MNEPLIRQWSRDPLSKTTNQKPQPVFLKEFSEVIHRLVAPFVHSITIAVQQEFDPE